MCPDSAFLFLEKAWLDGDITRLLLRRKKIKQHKAAKILGVTPPQFVQYLNNKYPVPSKRFARLIKLLQIEDPTLILLSNEARNG